MGRASEGRTAARMSAAMVEVTPPYDLSRSLAIAAAFAPTVGQPPGLLRFAVRIGGRIEAIEVRQTTKSTLCASYAAGGDRRAVQRTVGWRVLADLDLRPFYRLAARHPALAPILRRLRGLKPMRPAGLFEMAVVAITEQQISLAAAYAIRTRLVERFGYPAQGCWVFPDAGRLAAATLRQLRSTGLSRAKAGYVRALARDLESGRVDLDAIAALPDADAHDALMNIRGFGPWSADYVLVRGMARPDRVPLDDLGIRDVVGRRLGSGARASSSETGKLLAPFAPYRGLAAFYLLAEDRSAAAAARAPLTRRGRL